MTDQQPAPAGQAPAPLPPELVSAILRDPTSPYFPTQIGVFCDDCGVIETADFMVHEDMTKEERLGVARKHLVETKRWTCTPEDGDLCPACAAAARSEEQPAACGKCKTPFDPTDTRHDGHAQKRDTPYCRRCVDLCHDNEIADHRCVICA